MTAIDGEPEEASRSTHFEFSQTVLYPSELTVRAWLNKVSAQKGECLAHVELGPVELTLHCSAEARRIAAAFTAAADQLAAVENGTWSEPKLAP